jgi:hypothetical protein
LINNFTNRETEKIWEGEKSRVLPSEIQQVKKVPQHSQTSKTMLREAKAFAFLRILQLKNENSINKLLITMKRQINTGHNKV